MQQCIKRNAVYNDNVMFNFTKKTLPQYYFYVIKNIGHYRHAPIALFSINFENPQITLYTAWPALYDILPAPGKFLIRIAAVQQLQPARN